MELKPYHAEEYNSRSSSPVREDVPESVRISTETQPKLTFGEQVTITIVGTVKGVQANYSNDGYFIEVTPTSMEVDGSNKFSELADD